MKAEKLLLKLMDTIHCTYLDMGGNNKYFLTHKSVPVIKEIQLYFFLKDAVEKGYE